MSKLSRLAGIFLLALLPSLSQACPAALQNTSSQFLGTDTPCSLSDRYAKAKATFLEKTGQNADHIVDIYAPRLINDPTWISDRITDHFDPSVVYDPAPLTWNKWSAAATYIAHLASTNSTNNHFANLSVEWVRQMHAYAFNGLIPTAGQYRVLDEFGLALSQSSAITLDEADALNHSEYHSLLDPSRSLLSWHPVQCWEDLSDEFRAAHANDQGFDRQAYPENPNATFRGYDGVVRQCGYILYTPATETQAQLASLLNFLNGQASLYFAPSHEVSDPVLVAARVQRWFISIHPFSDGNGRMSRFLMEDFLQSIGLPAPVIENMDLDVYTHEQNWAATIGRGLLKTVETVEACATNPNIPGCNVVN